MFHAVQELVSAEKTPTLSIVLPMYEKLITLLQSLKLCLPKLSHAISASISKLTEYLQLSQCMRVYALAIGESFVLHIMQSFTYLVLSP